MGWGGVGSIVRVPGDVSASGRVGWIGVGWGGVGWVSDGELALTRDTK